MINVSDELKNAVINEEMPKVLTIQSNNNAWLKLFNWYTASPEETGGTTYYTYSGKTSGSTSANLGLFREKSIASDYSKYADWVVVSCDLNYGSATLENCDVSMRINAYYGGTIVQGAESIALPITDYKGSFLRVYTKLPAYQSGLGYFERISGAYFVYTNVSGTNSGTFAYKNLKVDFIKGDYEELPYNTFWANETNLNNVIGDSNLDLFINNSNIYEQSFAFEESICSADTLKLGGCEQAEIDFSAFNIPNITDTRIEASLNINDKGNFVWKGFTVSKCEKQVRGMFTIRNCVAYDDLHYLSQNGYAWYSQYAFGLNMTQFYDRTASLYVFDFERYIFSTFYNLMKSFGIESVCRHNETFISSKQYYDTSSDMYFDYKTISASSYGRIYYAKFSFTPDGSYQAYKAKMLNATTPPDDYLDFDPLYRGVSSACVCVVFHYPNNIQWGGLFDLDEPFIIPPTCTSVDVYVPTVYTNSNGQISDVHICDAAELYGVDFLYYNPNELVNAYEPLPYYPYTYPKPTVDDICKLGSSVSARECARSIMEMCGCFFRLSREGLPQFIYAQEHGLYPSNDLFPADDLFPKSSGVMTMPTSYYISAEFAEFQVEKFGGVQVVAQAKNNTGVVVRWEYWWDNTSDNAYIIDDNVFLCAEEMLDSVNNPYPNILQNLETSLDNLQYTPFTCDAIGTPFLESGDRFTLLTSTDGFESFIFNRKLKGIQALRDFYESRGKAKTPRIMNFEWE